jgi:hypothetical protein
MLSFFLQDECAFSCGAVDFLNERGGWFLTSDDVCLSFELHYCYDLLGMQLGINTSCEPTEFQFPEWRTKCAGEYPPFIVDRLV